jgi:hypothetical protein
MRMLAFIDGGVEGVERDGLQAMPGVDGRAARDGWCIVDGVRKSES